MHDAWRAPQRALWAALALLLSAACTSSSGALDAGNASPPGVVVSPAGITIPNFRREVSSSGTVFYFCEAGACERGSIVSYRRQPDRAPYSEREFRQVIADGTNRLHQVPGVEAVEVSACDYSANESFTVGTCEKKLTYAPGVSGKHAVYVSGFVAASGLLFTTSSSANTLDAARTNSLQIFAALAPYAIVVTGTQ